MPHASSKPLRIVLLDRKTLPDDIHFRAFSFAHELVQFDQTAPDEVPERIRMPTSSYQQGPVRGSAVASAPKLKLVAVAATGTDVVDVTACAQRGVIVSNIRNYAVNTVPEHTFALILALRRSLLAYRNSVQAGRWQEANQFCYFDFPINDLAGSTLGIIGDGALGRSVADLGRAFGMKVLFGLQGHQRNGAALYAVREGPRAQRHHHLALSLDAFDPQHDFDRGVRTDG